MGSVGIVCSIVSILSNRVNIGSVGRVCWVGSVAVLLERAESAMQAESRCGSTDISVKSI